MRILAGKHEKPFKLSPWGSGTGIVIGTDIDVAGIVSGPDTTTVAVSANGAASISSTGTGVQLPVPIALTGPVTCTSSGGSFAVLFRERVGNVVTEFWRALTDFVGLTFYKDFTREGNLDADYSIGSAAATRSVAYSASAPATYVDGNGVIQVVTTADARRMQGGHYTTDGFQVARGEMFEPTSTNLLKYTDGTAYADGKWTGFLTASSTITGSLTLTNTTIPTLTSIPSATSQRVQYTGVAGDAPDKSILLAAPGTENSSIAQNDVVTFSLFIRSSTGITGADTNLRITSYTDAGAGLNDYTSSNLTVTSAWTRVSFSTTITDATVGKVSARLRLNGIGNADVIDVEVYGFQLEKLPYATSFIPTTTAALTRPADNLKYATAGNRTAATESIFIKFMPYRSFANEGLTRAMSASDTKSRALFKTSDETVITFSPNATDSGACDAFTTTQPLLNVSYVAAFTCQHASPYAAAYMDGTLEGTETDDDFTDPAWGTYFRLGTGGSGTLQLHGIIQSVAIYSDVKAAADVAAITAVMNTATS